MPTDNLTTSGTLKGKYGKIPMSHSPRDPIPSVFVTMVAPKEKWMDGVFPGGVVKKIPKTIEVPYGSHINSGQTIDMAREKGYVLLEEAPREVQALVEEAANREKSGKTGWEEKIEELKAEPVAETKDIVNTHRTCAGTKNDGTPCARWPKAGEIYCNSHAR